jgi:hypothetical protein
MTTEHIFLLVYHAPYLICLFFQIRIRKITEIKMKPENECKVYCNGEGTGGERRDEKNSRKVKQKSNRKVKRQREEKRKQEKEQERMADNFKRLKKKKQNRTAEKERRDSKTVPKKKVVFF